MRERGSEMGIKNEDLAQIYEKAKTKKDGVYSFTELYALGLDDYI